MQKRGLRQCFGKKSCSPLLQPFENVIVKRFSGKGRQVVFLGKLKCVCVGQTSTHVPHRLHLVKSSSKRASVFFFLPSIFLPLTLIQSEGQDLSHIPQLIHRKVFFSGSRTRSIWPRKLGVISISSLGYWTVTMGWKSALKVTPSPSTRLFPPVYISEKYCFIV